MAETPTTQPQPLAPEVAAACEIAATDGEPAGDPILLRAAFALRLRKQYPVEWYRLVWRGGAWQYLSRQRLQTDGRDETWGRVSPGELVAQHDRGGPIDAVYLVVRAEKPLLRCTFARTGAGTLRITLPDGRVVERPDPRQR
jgi:hypothetical protein